jgi:hypothetical protein
MFGRSLPEWARFMRPVLVALVAVGLARGLLSVAGFDRLAELASTTALVLVGSLYAGVRVAVSGFGSYRHLFPMVLVQGFVANLLSALGVLAAAAGLSNIYATPEHSNLPNYLPHAIGHVIGGLTLVPAATWILASAALLGTRALRRGAAGVRRP